MMKKIILVSGLILFGLSSRVYSGVVSTDPTYVNMLRGLASTGAKGLMIQAEGAPINPKNCTDPSYYRVHSNEIADFDQQFSTLLAALTASKKVVLQISDTTCSNGYPMLNNVLIYR